MTWSCPICSSTNGDPHRLCEGCGLAKEQLSDLSDILADLQDVQIEDRVEGEDENLGENEDEALQSSDEEDGEDGEEEMIGEDGEEEGEEGEDDDDDHDAEDEAVIQLPIEVSGDQPYSVAYSSTIEERERSDEEKAQEIFDEIMAMCRSRNESYVDPNFAHDHVSLGNYRRDGDAVGGQVASQGLTWLRPSAISAKDRGKWEVFRDPQSTDIDQGTLGDCWFMSALALVAEQPGILLQIVLTKAHNPIGVYQIRLCVDGKWEIMTLDDFFPCHPDSRSLAFAVGKKNQLWVPLVEKALAKALGCYKNLRGGRTIEGLSILTGASCETISLEGDNVCHGTVWATLLSACETGFLLGCSCGCGRRSVNVQEYERKGLVARHAYSILDVRQEGTHLLLRLRNPWGRFEWNGAWSNNWNGWPPALRARLIEQNDRGPGTFWMSFADFMAHFDSVDVCRLRHNWSELRVSVPFGGSFNGQNRLLRILVENNTEVCINLHQSETRRTSDRIELMICVHEITTSGHLGKLIQRSSRERKNFVSTGEIVLRGGHYAVVCHSLGSVGQQRARKRAGMLVMHSSHPLFCEQLQCSPQVISDSLVHLLLKEGKTQGTKEDLCMARTLTTGFGGLIMMIENYHKEIYVHVRLDYSRSHNVASSRGTLTVADSVPPMHRQIVLLLTHSDPTQASSWGGSWKTRFVRKSELTDWSPSVQNASHYPSFDNQDIAELHKVKPVADKQDVKAVETKSMDNVKIQQKEVAIAPKPAENTWVTVKHGDPFPPGAMRILGRELVGNDVITKNCVYVAFWMTEDKYPVFGRARNNNGTVEAWFPLLGEHHSVNLGQFLLMTNTNQLSYRWVHPGNLENPKYCPVKVGGYCPAIVTWNGMEILGKAKLPMKIALTSYGGEEQRHEGDTYNHCLVLVRDV